MQAVEIVKLVADHKANFVNGGSMDDLARLYMSAEDYADDDKRKEVKQKISQTLTQQRNLLLKRAKAAGISEDKVLKMIPQYRTRTGGAAEAANELFAAFADEFGADDSESDDSDE